MLRPSDSEKAQIALEFLVVYSFVLVVFILIFSIVSSQRAVSLAQQQYSLLQLQTQNIASYIDEAVQAGTGYSATIPLISGLQHNYYNLSISSTGVVIASTQIGIQPLTAYAFSHAQGYVINGTLQRSANGINIYQIPTYRGTISISNIKGIIYIDQIPPQLTGFAQGAVVTQQANIKSISFNDSAPQKAYVGVNNSAAITLGSTFSMDFWFNAAPERQGCGTLVGKPKTSVQFAITLAAPCSPGYYSNDILDFNYGATSLASNAFPSGSWINAAATFNSASSTFTWYINGTAVNTYSGLANPATNSRTLYIGAGDFVFNGSMANLQIYNSVLTPNQVLSRYQSGIGGPPGNYNLMGWWPLNGNPNDYSGNGDQGIPFNNPKYVGVVQLNARPYSLSGNGIANALVGFVTSKGYLTSNHMYSSVYTSNDAVSRGFVTATSPSIQGATNISADLFNGNIAITGNLIGWWPLDIGYGANVADLSQKLNGGTFTGSWKQAVNQTNFIAAQFPGDIGGVNNNNVQDGFITVNSAQSLLGIVANRSFTVVEWIYYKGPTPGHNQGIFGNWPGSNGGGFQLVGYCVSCANNAVLYINTSYISFPNGLLSFPMNTWEMITAQYNGNSGTATVYLNNTVFASNVLAKNLGLLQLLPYYIGNDASQPGGLDTFNGLITNVQIYDSYLSQQQINNLYSSGISSPPLGNGGLIAWLPLLNNTIDSSYNMNNGTISDNVLFVNSAYNNTSQMTGPGFATFNGFTSVSIPYTQKLAATGSFSVSFWFSSAQGSYKTFSSELVDTDVPSGHALEILLCGNNSCGLTGIHGMIGSGAGWLSPTVDYPLKFTQNTWYSVTETFTTTTWTIYVNGNKASSGSLSGTPVLLNSGTGMTLGAGTGSSNTIGQMANLQVYNIALTQLQALQLYNQGLPIQYRMNTSLDT